MHIHLPHLKPIQRAAVRSLLGALLAILVSLILIFLMAVLMVFPDYAFSLNSETAPKHTKPAPKNVQPVNRPTSGDVALKTQLAREMYTPNLGNPGVLPMPRREPVAMNDLVPAYQ